MDASQKKVVWIIVAIVTVMFVLPMLVVVGAGVIGYLTFQQATETAQEQRIEAIEARERARREAETVHDVVGEAERRAEEAQHRAEEAAAEATMAAPAEPTADPADPLGGL